MYIITGMHRSGTSLTARLCLEAGMPMGPVDAFYPADRWNPHGYHENMNIRQLNIRLVHGPWWKFSYLRLPSRETILRRSRKMESSISAAAKQHADRLVKDSRFCITLPAWQRYGARIDGVVVCLREPCEVALSLQRRNGLPVRWGYELWHAHYVSLLQNLRSIPAHYLHYNRLLKPSLFVEEISPCFRFLGLQTPAEKIRQLGTNFVDPSMNHFQGRRDRYPKKVELLWRDLLERHRTKAV